MVVSTFIIPRLRLFKHSLISCVYFIVQLEKPTLGTTLKQRKQALQRRLVAYYVGPTPIAYAYPVRLPTYFCITMRWVIYGSDRFPTHPVFRASDLRRTYDMT